MFDNTKLEEALVQYKKIFVATHWKNEKYKWEAVKWFQDNWDIKATDFPSMLSKSLSKTFNLLASMNNFPAKMIHLYATNAPEEVRAMFIKLFDENKDLFSRIEEFKNESTILMGKYGKGQHFQTENAISTYLWLRYPDKYYIYKFGEIKKVAEELKSDFQFQKGSYSDNMRNFYSMYDSICNELKKDHELQLLLKSQLTEKCYLDPELKTLTIDVGFFISRYYSSEKQIDYDWFPQDYSPQLSVEDWTDLLNDNSVFTQSSLEIMKRMKDYGGQATCTQLAVKYGKNTNFYNSGSSHLARRIADKTGCPILERSNGDSKWWPILYLGRSADVNEDGTYIWKLRDELSEALDRFDTSDIQLFASSDSEEDERGYWWLNANPKIWSFSQLSVGEEQSYTLYNQNGNKRKVFQNFIDAKVGDYVIGYESNPVKQIVALGRISAEQDGKQIFVEKTEGLATPLDYQVLKSFIELEKMEYFVNSQGTLFKLTRGEYEFILDIIREDNPISIKEKELKKYSKTDFLKEVYIDEIRYDRLVSVLKNKRNIILQGAPGVGKTFAAKRLAYSIMEEQDESRIEFVQFHQNYSYEDFMMGYKPVENGFELKTGVFYRFCQRAANQQDKDYFFIIDEINRGNLSKIFGELLMLIEKDYRNTKITLAYNGISFSVPENVYIIGMMNTADRSLAMIDYALRRRFSFFDMEPGFNSEGFKKYQKLMNYETFNELISKTQELNNEIMNDRSLGKGFCVGHSYFLGKEVCNEGWLQSIVEYDILPMISEYWFDDTAKLQKWENILRGIFQ